MKCDIISLLYVYFRRASLVFLHNDLIELCVTTVMNHRILFKDEKARSIRVHSNGKIEYKKVFPNVKVFRTTKKFPYKIVFDICEKNFLHPLV